MHLRATIALVFTIAAVGAAPTFASAQDQDTALARTLFEEGLEHADNEQWEEAADRFRRALALRPSPIVAYNLGSALVELGQLVEASEAYRRTLRADGAPQDVRAAARESLEELLPRIASIEIELSGSSADVVVWLDGRALPREAVGVTMPVNPGDHEVTAMRNDRKVASHSVSLAEGDAEAITLDIPPPSDEEGDGETGQPDPILGGGAATAPPSDEGGGSALPWILIGVGVAVAAGAAIALWLLLSDGDVEAPVPGNLQPMVVEF